MAQSLLVSDAASKIQSYDRHRNYKGESHTFNILLDGWNCSNFSRFFVSCRGVNMDIKVFWRPS